MPEDILDTNPLAESFAIAVRGLFLSIGEFADLDRFAASTQYPQPALLLAALHWSYLPLHIITAIVLGEIRLRKYGWAFWQESRGGNGSVGIAELKIALSAPLWIAGLMVLTMLPGDWSLFGDGLTTNSRLGMSTMFLIGFWITAMIFLALYAFGRAYLKFNVGR
jgi:hypothetical protein